MVSGLPSSSVSAGRGSRSNLRTLPAASGTPVNGPRPGPRPMGSTDRYSPVRVSALLHLPESNARSFMIASALGNALDGDGTRNSLKSAKDATGVVISKRRREVILEVLVINPRRWRQLVDDWTDRYIAHRCSPGVVALFTKPLLTECPNCHRWIEGSAEAKPPMKSKPRGRSFGRTAVLLPLKRQW